LSAIALAWTMEMRGTGALAAATADVPAPSMATAARMRKDFNITGFLPEAL
jgi:hypothetical protein